MEWVEKLLRRHEMGEDSMIRTVAFKNFKGLRDVRLDLERLTVLVGPNASGKTSVLEGIYFLTQSDQEGEIPIFRKTRNIITHYTRGATGLIELVLEAGDSPRKVVLYPPPANAVSSSWRLELYSGKDSEGRWVGTDPRRWVGTEACKHPLPVASLLRLDAKRLADPSFSLEAQPRIGQDGEGLASALAYLRLNRPTEFDRLLGFLRTIFPYVQGIRFDRAEIVRTELESVKVNDQLLATTVKRTYWGEEIVLDLEGAPNIPAPLASDGTLLVLGLLAVIMGSDRPRLILLDDLDHGLHPKAQGDLVVLLRKLMEHDPELQILATSHSPYLLDHLDAREVRLTTRRNDGSVACARLDEHPDFERWREAMTPGEFWSMVGEKWVGERQLEAAGS